MVLETVACKIAKQIEIVYKKGSKRYMLWGHFALYPKKKSKVCSNQSSGNVHLQRSLCQEQNMLEKALWYQKIY